MGQGEGVYVADLIIAKPAHLIGASTGFNLKAFQAMYEGVLKRGGEPEVVICGSQAVAEDAYSAAEILGYKLAIVLDTELSPKRFWLTSLKALSDFPGGGQH
jgi:hypothetical protein